MQEWLSDELKTFRFKRIYLPHPLATKVRSLMESEFLSWIQYIRDDVFPLLVGFLLQTMLLAATPVRQGAWKRDSARHQEVEVSKAPGGGHPSQI